MDNLAVTFLEPRWCIVRADDRYYVLTGGEWQELCRRCGHTVNALRYASKEGAVRKAIELNRKAQMKETWDLLELCMGALY